MQTEKEKVKPLNEEEEEQSSSSNKILNINENDIIMINSMNNKNDSETPNITIDMKKEDNNSNVNMSKSNLSSTEKNSLNKSNNANDINNINNINDTKNNNDIANANKANNSKCHYLNENKDKVHIKQYIYCTKCDIIFCLNCESYHLKVNSKNHEGIDNNNCFIKENNIEEQNKEIIKDLDMFKKNNLDDYLYLEVELKNENDSLLELKNKVINIFDNLDKEYQKQLMLLQKTSSTQKDKIEEKAQKYETAINDLKKIDKNEKNKLGKFFTDGIELYNGFQKDKKKIEKFLKNIPKKIINNINRNIVKHKKTSFSEISNIIMNNTPNIINSDYLSETNILEMSTPPSMPNSTHLLDSINNIHNNSCDRDKKFLGLKRKSPANINDFTLIQKENSFSIINKKKNNKSDEEKDENARDKIDKKTVEHLKRILLRNFANINKSFQENQKKKNISNKNRSNNNSLDISSFSSLDEENKSKEKKHIPKHINLRKKINNISQSNINITNNISTQHVSFEFEDKSIMKSKKRLAKVIVDDQKYRINQHVNDINHNKG